MRSWTKDVYQHQIFEPQGMTIEAMVLEDKGGEQVMVKFALAPILSRGMAEFDLMLLWAINVLQENTGVTGQALFGSPPGLLVLRMHDMHARAAHAELGKGHRIRQIGWIDEHDGPFALAERSQRRHQQGKLTQAIGFDEDFR